MATRRPNGMWRAQVFVGFDENGKRTYKSFEARTEDEADFLALSFKLGKGKVVKTDNITLRSAMRIYIDSKRGILSPSTIVGYETIERNFGEFLDTRLCDVTKVALQTAIASYMFRKRNDRRGGGTLSAKTVRNAYGLISATLKQNGIELGEIALPRKAEIEYATPFDSELSRILECVRGTNVEIPVLLAACHSLRREEICGLRYDDIDFETGRTKIRRAKLVIKGEEIVKEPKTAKSKRTIFLSEYVLKLIQEKKEKDGGDYIITYRPDAIGKRFTAILKANNLPHCRFHDLRHSFASILHEHGIDPLYIRTVGGWSSDRVMNAVYVQVAERSIKDKSAVANSVFDSLLQPSATKDLRKIQ